MAIRFMMVMAVMMVMVVTVVVMMVMTIMMVVIMAVMIMLVVVPVIMPVGFAVTIIFVMFFRLFPCRCFVAGPKLADAVMLAHRVIDKFNSGVSVCVCSISTAMNMSRGGKPDLACFHRVHRL